MKITTAGAAAMVLAAICAVSLAIALPPSDGVGELVFIGGEDSVDLSIIGGLSDLGSVSFPSSLTDVTGSAGMTFYVRGGDGDLEPVTDVSADVLAGHTFEFDGSGLVEEDAPSDDLRTVAAVIIALLVAAAITAVVCRRSP